MSHQPVAEAELLTLNQKLLETIVDGDWKTYCELCSEQLTAFEPESRGQLVEGLGFHRYYFDLPGGGGPTRTTMVAPRVQLLGGDAAVVCYVRLTQRLSADGEPVTSRSEETRVWQRIDGHWRHVHFHRSMTT